MKISDQEKRNAWLSFASAAIAGFGPDSEELDDLEREVTELADGMLEAYIERFEKEGKRGRGRRRSEREDEEE